MPKMECNKEDAFRAKEMAEKKFIERDIAGAKKFAMKAQNLFPGLDGLSQFQATLDVYISAEERIDGEVDWYKVLGVEMSANEETVRKHYRKLALILHPDKNKSVGAEGAFKIVSEAWSLLSDKAKRSAYDQKRNLWDIYRKIPNYKSAIPTGQNGFHNLFNNNNSNSTTQKNDMHPQPVPPSHFSKFNTFWTICLFCKTQFEYLRTYINHNLFCQNCRQPFYAVEMPSPSINGNGPSTTWTSHFRGQNSTHHTRIENAHASGKKPVSIANVGPFTHPGTFAKAGDVRSVLSVDPTTGVRGESLKRKIHTFGEAATNLATGSPNACSFTMEKGDRLKKKRRIYDRMNYTGIQMANRNGVGESGTPKGGFETEKGKASASHKFNRARELSQLELRNILMDKAKKDICKKLKDRSIPSAASKVSEQMEKEKEKQKAPLNGMEADGHKWLDTKTKSHMECSLANSNDDPDTKGDDRLSMTVPDPDFHDFDRDRTEKSFGDCQVWAAYDDDDGMPRYYAMIHSVISLKPFRMRISWLNSKSNRELSPLNWIGSGFYKTSGDFWIGKHEVNKSLNSFSHKVNKWAKGTRGTIQIYPSKGEIWAIYRNWSSDWNELTPDEVIHKYDMVEVLEDYNDERGVTVAPLVKVAGFKTVFCRHSDSRKTKRIPREELFRFSHQVPSYLLTGQEGHNAPRGCWELDPASMPLELLRVLTEVEEKETVEHADKAKDPLGDVKKATEEQLIENGETTKEKIAVKGAAKEDVAELRMDKGREIKGDKLIVYKRRRNRN
ncbi:hypothetical protein JCGZ_26441 [Jatropha curcas]|uniref:J domain-containing protein n=1 Tax=Jatropha curcas TaxID=180498 RepID=A0A067JRJ7_JATCU|nr:uncharacterized protein LOC105648791 [Jatropha curcas]XP_012090687.1 uncharacterized protein LOC105648791 [Jatropha curcas]XP_012090688.1 uncharacterized protein LOC105648791 [Jatropha curcas]KDP22610.1 hypothetical protein JCGZ_26441 [Jatropha curcas]